MNSESPREYTVNLTSVSEDRDVPAVIRQLALDAKKNGNCSIKAVLAQLCDIDLKILSVLWSVLANNGTNPTERLSSPDSPIKVSQVSVDAGSDLSVRMFILFADIVAQLEGLVLTDGESISSLRSSVLMSFVGMEMVKRGSKSIHIDYSKLTLDQSFFTQDFREVVYAYDTAEAELVAGVWRAWATMRGMKLFSSCFVGSKPPLDIDYSKITLGKPSQATVAQSAPLTPTPSPSNSAALNSMLSMLNSLSKKGS